MILLSYPTEGQVFYKSLYDIATVYTTFISPTGVVRFMGKVDSVSYNLDEWKVEEIIKDFAKTRMVELLKRKGFKIYKCEEL